MARLKSGVWVAFGSMGSQWKQMPGVDKSLHFSSAEVKLSSQVIYSVAQC